jgi:hypothetical protein
MKKTYFLFLLFCIAFCSTAYAANFRGFLLTKDNYRLTGYINKIEYSISGIVIQFTNDFGDQYNIYPNLVNGFGFSNGGETFRYVSRYYEGRWLFLRALESGKRLNLFRAPDGNQRWVDDSFQAILANPISDFWLQPRGQKIIPLQRIGFKRQLRQLLAESAPALANKIGKKGYRFKNIQEIVVMYNNSAKRSRRKL